MIEIEVPKDITKYESKLVGAFTGRQVACLVIAAGIGIPLFLFLTKNNAVHVPRDFALFAVMLVMIPAVLMGWFKPYGMNFEQFVKVTFVSNVLSPKRRKYVTKNSYEYVDALLTGKTFNDEAIAKESKLLSKKEMRKEMNKKVKCSIKNYA